MQYNPRALDILNSTSSLIEVCNYLADPTSEKYINTYYQLFAPIKPMLVARMTLDNIINTFHEVDVIVETKWDGERIQCHLNNKVVKFFSRNGIDYTYLYGPKLSHLIISCVNAQSAILDGEIVADIFLLSPINISKSSKFISILSAYTIVGVVDLFVEVEDVDVDDFEELVVLEVDELLVVEVFVELYGHTPPSCR